MPASRPLRVAVPPVAVDPRTHKRVCGPSTENAKIEVYEFWSNDIRQQFTAAGIRRKTPPAYPDSCESGDSQGRAPQILSPAKNVTIMKSHSAESGLNSVALSAVIDDDTEHVYWYLDDRFLKKTRNQEIHLRAARRRHVLR